MIKRIDCPLCGTPHTFGDETQSKTFECRNCKKLVFPGQSNAKTPAPIVKAIPICPVKVEPAEPPIRVADKAPEQTEVKGDPVRPRRKKKSREAASLQFGVMIGVLIMATLIGGGALIYSWLSGDGGESGNRDRLAKAEIPVATAPSVAVDTTPALPPVDASTNEPAPQAPAEPQKPAPAIPPPNTPAPPAPQAPAAPQKSAPGIPALDLPGQSGAGSPRSSVPADPTPAAPPIAAAGPNPPGGGEMLLPPKEDPGNVAGADPLKKETKTTMNLPGPIGDICVGANGRYLILHLPVQRQLAVFDAYAAKIIKYIPLTDDIVLIAANRSKVFVVVPDKQKVFRWSLTTFEQEAWAALPWKNKVYSVAMGSASDGPLNLGGPELGGRETVPLRLLDTHTLREIPVTKRLLQGVNNVVTLAMATNLMRVSADGRVLGMWDPQRPPFNMDTVLLNGGSASVYHESKFVGHVVPSPDGRAVYTADGVYGPDCKKLGGAENGWFCLPSVHGYFYLALESDFLGSPRGIRSLSFRSSDVLIHLAGDAKPVARLNDVEGLDLMTPQVNGTRLTLDKRIYLIPLAKMIVTIPAAADKLHLYRFDLDDALEKAGVDYLVVTSQPVAVAIKGKEYLYQLTVKAKQGGIKYRLEAGPKGMRITSDGKLMWSVPPGFTGNVVDVIIAVSDNKGQEVFHTFKVAVESDAPPAAGEAAPM